MRRTFGALLAAGGLALLLVLGMTSSASAGDDKPKDDKVDDSTDYTSTTVTTITTTSTVPDSTTTTNPPVTVQRNRLTRDPVTPSQTLPVTGSDVMGLTLLGAGVLAVGGGLVWYSRRSQAAGSDAS